MSQNGASQEWMPQQNDSKKEEA